MELNRCEITFLSDDEDSNVSFEPEYRSIAHTNTRFSHLQKSKSVLILQESMRKITCSSKTLGQPLPLPVVLHSTPLP